MSKENEKKHHRSFEALKKTNRDGMDFWFARELQPVLDYSTWDKFKRVIAKAMQACINSGQPAENHFSHMVKMVSIGSRAEREIEDYELSRYACYLIVQNADPSKSIIANGQTYFAIQTRRQELADDETFQRLKEDEKRLFLRNELKEHNKPGNCSGKIIPPSFLPRIGIWPCRTTTCSFWGSNIPSSRPCCGNSANPTPQGVQFREKSPICPETAC
jgi:hypothetical protein